MLVLSRRVTFSDRDWSVATNTWSDCEVKASNGKDLMARGFHSAMISDNLLYLWGGLSPSAHALIEVINLGTFFSNSSF